MNWQKLGRELRISADDAHEGNTPPVELAYGFLLDNPDELTEINRPTYGYRYTMEDAKTGRVPWPDNMPDDPPLTLKLAYYGITPSDDGLYDVRLPIDCGEVSYQTDAHEDAIRFVVDYQRRAQLQRGDWPWCRECKSWHYPDNPTCVLKIQQGAKRMSTTQIIGLGACATALTGLFLYYLQVKRAEREEERRKRAERIAQISNWK